MGFYDCNCMVTGVSLMPVGATLVLLRRTGEHTYVPVSLGISGQYDRLGGIDAVAEDRGTELVVDYFTEQLRRGRFMAVDQLSDGPYRWPSPDDHSAIEALLEIVERTTTMWGPGWADPSTTFDGDVITSALVAQPIWDALAGSAGTSPDSVEAQFDAAFTDEIPKAMYGDRLSEVAEQVRQFAAVDAFIRARRLRWAAVSDDLQRYPSAYDQHGREEMRTAVAAARHDYRDVPAILAGLDAYATEVGDLLD